MNLFKNSEEKAQFLACADSLYFAMSGTMPYHVLLSKVSAYKRDFGELPGSIEDLKARPILTIESTATEIID